MFKQQMACMSGTWGDNYNPESQARAVSPFLTALYKHLDTGTSSWGHCLGASVVLILLHLKKKCYSQEKPGHTVVFFLFVFFLFFFFFFVKQSAREN